jgi:TolB protein
MNADGSGQTRLTVNAASDEVPAWTANGQIVFTSDRSGNFELYVMRADESDVRRLTNDASQDYFPAPAPRGDRIAFMSDRDGTFDLYTTTIRGGPVRRVTDSPGCRLLADFAPDGHSLAFVRWDRTDRVLYTVSLDGSRLTRITNAPGREEVAPAWSPDGDRIVFLGCSEGTCDLIVRSAKPGGTETTLIHGGAGAPDWQAVRGNGDDGEASDD